MPRGLPVSEQRARHQDTWEAYRERYIWRIADYIDEPARILGPGHTPEQDPIHLDPDAPLLLHHVRPDAPVAPAPQPKPKPRARIVGKRGARRPQPAPPLARNYHALQAWTSERAALQAAPAVVQAWTRIVPYDGPPVQPAAPYYCDQCGRPVQVRAPIPRGLYAAPCLRCGAEQHYVVA